MLLIDDPFFFDIDFWQLSPALEELPEMTLTDFCELNVPDSIWFLILISSCNDDNYWELEFYATSFDY